MRRLFLIAICIAAPLVSVGMASAAYNPTFTGQNGLLAPPRVPPPETLVFSGAHWAVIPEQGDGGCSKNVSLWLARARPLGPYTIAHVPIVGPAHSQKGTFRFLYSIAPGQLRPGWRTFNATNGCHDGATNYTKRSVTIRVF
jgi:hypothetical protein